MVQPRTQPKDAGNFFRRPSYLTMEGAADQLRRQVGEANMDGNFVGLAAVIMVFGIPMAAMYTFFRVRKLRSEERLAAIARGVDVPMQPELSESARSRRSGILLVAGALGYIVTFVLIGRVEPDA